jgi:beta-glucosidase
VSGDGAGDVLWRVENGELDPALVTPETIVLLIGTNDLGADKAPGAVAANVKEILDAMKLRQPKSRIILLGIFPREADANSPLRRKVRETNALLKSLAGGQVEFVDLSHVFLQSDGSLSAEVMPDYLHPNREGYRRWGERMAGMGVNVKPLSSDK